MGLEIALGNTADCECPTAKEGNDVMPDTPEISETKRALLEKYVLGELPQTAMAAGAITRREAEVAAPRERAVAVQTEGSKRPFFFLHGQFEGNAFFCYPLAHELGQDQPFYVLEPYRFDGLPVPPTFEEIAAAHLKSLRAVQLEGPYLLGGWCNGGLLAYEIARQLLAEGQKVDLLVLMDPVTLTYPARIRLLHWVISRIGNLMRLGRDKQLDWFLRLQHIYKHMYWYGYLCLRPIYRYLRHAYRYVRYSRYRRLKASERLFYFGTKKFTEPLLGTPEQIKPGPGVDKASFAFPRLDSKTLRQNYPRVYDWVALSYVPPNLYPGKVTFFWTSGERFRRGWRKVEEANEVEVYLLPGRHMNTLAEHLHVLAEHLRRCLNKAQEATLRERE